MASKTEICNFALSHIGVGKDILDLDTDPSEEGKVCRRFYDITRQDALRGYRWPFANVIAALGLVEENPNTEWAYSYRYPSGAVKLLKILSGVRNDTRQSRVTYKISKDATARLIYTDEVDAYIEYTEDIDEPSFYSPDFTLALSYKLAANIAPRLGKGDPFEIVGKMLALYDQAIQRAFAFASDEEQPEEQPESQFVRVRE